MISTRRKASPPAADVGGTRSRNNDDRSKNEVKNSNLDLRFKANTEFGKAVRACKIGEQRRELLQESVAICVPPDGNGNKRCLNWHLKGKCNKTCNRASDHVALNVTSKLDMFNYAQQMCPGS